jgi:hypothetical protein
MTKIYLKANQETCLNYLLVFDANIFYEHMKKIEIVKVF